MNNIDVMSVNALRVIGAEGVQKANSGHPGLPIGAAPMGYMLYKNHIRTATADMHWVNRDRFVLSAGHGCMMLYSLLHIFEYGVTIEDLTNFRQYKSRTSGHPEIHNIPGVDMSTGPLGAGIAGAVGFAMAEAHLAAIFNKPGFQIFDHYTYAIAGDGCLQEGVASEACSLAGTLKLGKLILLYDRNRITIEGDIDVAFDEDVAARFKAYGFSVFEVADGNTDLDSIDKAFVAAKADPKPSLIIVNTTIGYGVEGLQGTGGVHGSPIGAENIKKLKAKFGLDVDKDFFIPEETYAAAKQTNIKNAKIYADWCKMFEEYAKQYPELAKLYDTYLAGVPAGIFGDDFYAFDKDMATRQTSGELLNRLSAKLPQLIGGSADLAPSNLTVLKDRAYLSPENYGGSNIHYGIREYAMGVINNSLSSYGMGLIPFCATFFVFSDLLKHAVRLAALDSIKSIFVMTHDSIGVGEDGPTHQPVEQFAAFRAMPNTYLWRPADGRENAAAYEFALTTDAPSVLALSRNSLPLLEKSGKEALKGGYIVYGEGTPELIIIATGAEVGLAINAAKGLETEGKNVRVVSMPCTEVFDMQSAEYKESVLPNSVRARLAVETGSSYGWAKYVGLDGETVCMDRFGMSAPCKFIYDECGFTVENVVNKAKTLI